MGLKHLARTCAGADRSDVGRLAILAGDDAAAVPGASLEAEPPPLWQLRSQLLKPSTDCTRPLLVEGHLSAPGALMESSITPEGALPGTSGSRVTKQLGTTDQPGGYVKVSIPRGGQRRSENVGQMQAMTCPGSREKEHRGRGGEGGTRVTSRHL